MNTETKHKIGKIFQEEKERLLNFIRQKVNRTEDAEDILQDIFLQTLRGYSITEPIENLAGWLYVSARNRIIDFYRKRKHPHLSLDQQVDSATLESLISETHLNPETEFFRQLVADTIAEAIASLPEKQHQVVVWQMIEGRTFQEISDMTGESINTLLSRKRYAIQILRTILYEIKTLLNE
ncbi:sigma-70 family RNA polymerase sigma factor [bacterium]|nr:sigma-70 family RNA polymerase sigma factor [bacterium]